MDWQPIETAPKDGQLFIATRNGYVVLAWWEPHTDQGDDYGFCFIGKDEIEGPDNVKANAWLLDYEPTRWMPLPEPPK